MKVDWRSIVGFHSRAERIAMLLFAAVCATCAVACCVVYLFFFWGCALKPAPSPFPGASTAERAQRTTAVIVSEKRVTTYTTRGIPIQRLIDHYAAEMLWTCQAGSVVQLAPEPAATAAGSGDVLYRGGCSIMKGGTTFYPEGGYSFKDTQTFSVDAVLHPGGTVDVTQVNSYATRC